MEIQPDKKTFRNYLFFWSGQIFSIFGSSIVFFVLVWWITVTTGDRIAISIATFTYFIPMIIVSPIAGIITDRYDRKKVILLVDSLQAYSTLILIIFFIFNRMQYWILLIFTAIRSVCQAFHMPTANAIIPTMVPKDKLSRINGINFLFTTFVNVIGPIVGGTLLVFFTLEQIEHALWIDVITFLIALIPLLIIKIPRVNAHVESHERESFGSAFKGGLKIIYAVPGLLSMMIAFMILNFMAQPQGTLMPYYIRFDNGGTVVDYSIISMSFNIGMFIGGITTALKKNWKHKMRVIYIAYIIMGIGNILIASVPKGYILLIIIFAPITGFAGPVINSLYFTLIHLRVPKDKVGRVISIDTSLSFIAMPIGTLLAGPLANIMGTANLFLTSAILSIIIISMFYILTNMRSLGVIEEIEATENNSLGKID